MPNYSFQSSACAESKIPRFFRESFAALSSFTFCFLSSPLLLFFFPPFFSFCGAFTRLPFGGKRFCKTFEDREFFWKEVPVGSGTRFSLEFSGQSYTVFCVFLWCLTESRSFGYGLKDLISVHKVVVKVV